MLSFGDFGRYACPIGVRLQDTPEEVSERGLLKLAATPGCYMVRLYSIKTRYVKLFLPSSDKIDGKFKRSYDLLKIKTIITISYNFRHKDQ